MEPRSGGTLGFSVAYGLYCRLAGASDYTQVSPLKIVLASDKRYTSSEAFVRVPRHLCASGG
jgi:hypothetical protein